MIKYRLKLWSGRLRRLRILPVLLIATLLPVESIAKDDDKFVVVIDAGHGGHDTGACDNGAKEKDINLGVALKLGEMIKKKMKSAKVVYTRDDDTFVSLQGRADIANKAKGDLFISIHTNSLDRSNKNRASVSGASVYALGLHKDDNNMAVARRENSVIELESDYKEKYSGFDPSKDESYILFEMAQKKNLSKSIKFAGDVQKQLVANAGRKDRGVHQAGFWVLWATSMPAVLIELDFICNPTEAKFISGSDGQQKLAASIYEAVKNYEASYHSIGANSAMLKRKQAESNAALHAATGTSREEAAASRIEAKSEAKETTAVAPVAEREPAAESTVELAASRISAEERRHAAAASRKATVAKRRRRSDAGRAISDASVQTAENIMVSGDKDRYVVAAAEKSESSVAAESKETAPVKESKKKKKSTTAKRKKKQETRTYQNRQVAVSTEHVEVTGQPARRAKSSRVGRRQSFSTVYKIQILASEEQLKQNNDRFLGLKPISSFRENNLYKYTYGESKDKKDMERMLKKVREKFPDAFIITCISD